MRKEVPHPPSSGEWSPLGSEHPKSMELLKGTDYNAHINLTQ
jgi:hypothetical protein